MQNFRNLVVWKKAHALTLELYKSAASFPAEERFGLTSQNRRCSASIAANIAEVAADRVMENSIASCRYLWGQRVNSNIICS